MGLLRCIISVLLRWVETSWMKSRVAASVFVVFPTLSRYLGDCVSVEICSLKLDVSALTYLRTHQTRSLLRSCLWVVPSFALRGKM